MMKIKTKATITMVALILVVYGNKPNAKELNRRWVGPDYLAMPMYDWYLEDDNIIVSPGSFGGVSDRKDTMGSRLHSTTHYVDRRGRLNVSFNLKLLEEGKGEHKAGLWLGLKSRTPSPENVWIHPEEETAFFIGLNAAGNVLVGSEKSKRSLSLKSNTSFKIAAHVAGGKTIIKVIAKSEEGTSVTIEDSLSEDVFFGYSCISASANDSKWQFNSWTMEGDAISYKEENIVGPVIWSQYSLSGNIVKLQTQLVPLEESDADQVFLDLKEDGKWKQTQKVKIEPVSSTALFRLEGWDDTKSKEFRVRYTWNGKEYSRSGIIRANPKDRNDFSLGVFNCDHGELFPQKRMVRNVTIQNPDLLYFAGDQIYENMDKFKIIREPFEGARLSYFTKWYQFGLTWRSLLEDRPSVIIPDDHDVFMGNVWGDEGRGYVMSPEWVNMIQRTQTGSLPDPVDPQPVERGIEVYFTQVDYAGMSFAVIEDRKFKSSPGIIPESKKKANGMEIDIKGAQLLGKRQLDFLKTWNEETESLPVRWFLSQTMFVKASTHAGGKLKRAPRSTDPNGWPQSGRNRALKTIDRDVIMVHGDQHIGMLARMGIKKYDDGPVAFMVTGSSVGFPRAWWPEKEAVEGPINGPYTGKYKDDLGNYMTVYGVTNPKPLSGGVTDAYNRPGQYGRYELQHIKGSGHGIIIVDKQKRTAWFEAYRLDFDASKPSDSDQFDGFPYMIKLR